MQEILFKIYFERRSSKIPNIRSAKLCKPVYDIINYSTFICPFEPGKWKRREKLQKFKYLEKKKSSLDEIESLFHSFS